jgi:Predicted acyltransferases
MGMRTTSDKYSTLDGLRGVAAMLVVMYHFPGFFRPVYVENSYLMVDLFFVMSGFVIASAYEEKLSCGNISPLRFMRLRLIRLYPLYALGTYSEPRVCYGGYLVRIGTS